MLQHAQTAVTPETNSEPADERCIVCARGGGGGGGESGESGGGGSGGGVTRARRTWAENLGREAFAQFAELRICRRQRHMHELDVIR